MIHRPYGQKRRFCRWNDSGICELEVLGRNLLEIHAVKQINQPRSHWEHHHEKTKYAQVRVIIIPYLPPHTPIRGSRLDLYPINVVDVSTTTNLHHVNVMAYALITRAPSPTPTNALARLGNHLHERERHLERNEAESESLGVRDDLWFPLRSDDRPEMVGKLCSFWKHSSYSCCAPGLK